MNLNVRATEELKDGEVLISGDSKDLVELGRWLEGGGTAKC